MWTTWKWLMDLIAQPAEKPSSSTMRRRESKL